MPTQIIIEGDMVRTVETTVVSQVRLEDLLPRIETRPPIFVGPLPKTQKFMYWDESNPDRRRAVILAELEPGRRNCRYENRRYDLSIPWTYFRFDFQAPNNGGLDGQWQQINSRVFWAQEPVTSLDSPLGRALAPNCSPDGAICYGNTAIPANIPFGARVDRLVHTFWLSTFMHDSGTGSPWGSETGTTSWNRWALESRDDPHAWRRFPEWNLDSNVVGNPAIGPMMTVRDVLQDVTPRPTFINIEDAMMPMQIPMTFGRAGEVIRGWNPDQRFRFRRAMEIFETEHGADEIRLAPPPTGEVDDIGTPIAPDEQ